MSRIPLSLLVGLSVGDTTLGTLVANLGFNDVDGDDNDSGFE